MNAIQFVILAAKKIFAKNAEVNYAMNAGGVVVAQIEIPDKLEERCGAEIWHAVEGKYIKGRCDLRKMHTGQHGALLSWDGLEPQQQGMRKDA